MPKLNSSGMKPGEKGYSHLLLAVFGMAAALLAGIGLYLTLNGKFLPGPVSAANKHSQELGGYVSHAEFERQCSHCHAPLHCITDTRCQDCHMDIAQQRASASGLHSLLPGTQRCQNCHIEHQGREASITKIAFLNVDHQKLSEFSLEKHQQDYDGSPMGCDSCHSNQQFMKETMDCISCHAAEDHDYIAAHIEAYGAGCVDCHDGRDRMIDFDHNLVYRLDGAHQELDCNTCHLDKQYASTRQECAECHEEPEMHTGVFGLDCARCHDAQAWAPARLVQHTFVLEHGDEGISACETCHAGAYTEYPCYTCHSAEAMRWEHLLLDILDTSNCIECHPTGREGDTINAQMPAIQQENSVTSSGY